MIHEVDRGIHIQCDKDDNKVAATDQDRLNALRKAIELAGPVQPSMPHFGKLTGWRNETYHCHLKKGKPAYVAVWQVKDRTVYLVEVIYAGTHEKAPY